MSEEIQSESDLSVRDALERLQRQFSLVEWHVKNLRRADEENRQFKDGLYYTLAGVVVVGLTAMATVQGIMNIRAMMRA